MSEDVLVACAAASDGEGASVPKKGPVSGMRLVRVEGFEAAGHGALSRNEAYQRRFAMLFVDEASARRGGVGEVLRAENTRGERFAVKRLTAHARNSEEGEEASARRSLMRALFDAEYDAHGRLTGLKGFPRLFGRGEIEGAPVIIMEWVEGATLEKAMRSLAVDDKGRVSPLTVARMGRDLFDLLASMDYLAEGLAHRDLSPRNIMVDTSRVSLPDQVEEGVFELRLIDFGSAAVLAASDGSVTARCGMPRGATADYAPPEMLTEDRAEVEALRCSPAVDVYAAASVLYALLEGRPPYDLGYAAGADRGTFSAYRVKSEYAAEPASGAHAAAADIAAVLSREPEVAVATGRAAATLDAPPSAARVRLALSRVDDALGELLGACLVVDQRHRPTAAAMRDALRAFSENYGDNIGRALRGEPLLPCPLGGSAAVRARSSARRRRWARGALRAACAALWAVAVFGTGALVSGIEASVALGDVRWEGSVPGWVAMLVLAFPALLGLGLRERDLRSNDGLARGVLGVLFGAAVVGGALSMTAWPARSVSTALYAALFLAAMAPICGLVADRIFALPRARRGKDANVVCGECRPVLPHGALPGEIQPSRAMALGDESSLTVYELAEE